MNQTGESLEYQTSKELEALADGSTLMLMGTADAVVEGPKTNIVFEEDLTGTLVGNMMAF